jgi:hypothetical protein
VICRTAPTLLLNRPLRLAVGLLLCIFAAGRTFATEPVDRDAPGANSETGLSGGSGTADTQAKKQALSFGLVMLAGIIVGGTMLLTLVVVWGNRARRLARSPLPAVSKRDELWFLKPKKDAGEDPGGVSKNGPESEPEME